MESVNPFKRESHKFPIIHVVITLGKHYSNGSMIGNVGRKNDRSSYISVTISCFGGGIKEEMVNLCNKTCSCRVFQLDQLVYAHAITTYCCANFIILASAGMYCRIDFMVTSVDPTKR